MIIAARWQNMRQHTREDGWFITLVRLHFANDSKKNTSRIVDCQIAIILLRKIISRGHCRCFTLLLESSKAHKILPPGLSLIFISTLKKLADSTKISFTFFLEISLSREWITKLCTEWKSHLNFTRIEEYNNIKCYRLCHDLATWDVDREVFDPKSRSSSGSRNQPEPALRLSS